MEDNKFFSIVNNIGEDSIESFLERNSSQTNVTIDYEKIEFDYSWLEKIEITIPYLDNIVRNPKRFIMQEEEIVPVEKARKITVETVKHLATHTNLIQDISDEGDITPSHLLNIHKEESFDIYENRFIYSLLVNLQMFIKRRSEVSASGSSCKSYKKLNYIGETVIGDEKVKMSVDLEANNYDDLVNKDVSKLSLSDRIGRVSLIVSDFMKSAFIRDLTSGQIQPVRSPITKTNTILKNTNFQKALELWEFIERYDVNSKSEKKDNRSFEDKGEIKDNMDMSFLVNYLILNDAFEGTKPQAQAVKKYYLTKVIKDFVDKNDMDQKEFIKLLSEEFNILNKEKLVKEKYFVDLFKKAIKKYYNHRKNLLKKIVIKVT